MLSQSQFKKQRRLLARRRDDAYTWYLQGMLAEHRVNYLSKLSFEWMQFAGNTVDEASECVESKVDVTVQPMSCRVDACCQTDAIAPFQRKSQVKSLEAFPEQKMRDLVVRYSRTHQDANLDRLCGVTADIVKLAKTKSEVGDVAIFAKTELSRVLSGQGAPVRRRRCRSCREDLARGPNNPSRTLCLACYNERRVLEGTSTRLVCAGFDVPEPVLAQEEGAACDSALFAGGPSGTVSGHGAHSAVPTSSSSGPDTAALTASHVVPGSRGRLYNDRVCGYATIVEEIVPSGQLRVRTFDSLFKKTFRWTIEQDDFFVWVEKDGGSKWPDDFR